MSAGKGRTGRIIDFGAAKSIEEGESIKERNQAAFESELGVLGLLGRPGTFDAPVFGPPGKGLAGSTSPLPGTAGAGGGLLGEGTKTRTESGLLASGSLFREKEISPEASFAGFSNPIQKSKILDAEKFQEFVSTLPTFQIVSRQVAEAQGLTDPNSPFRQSLEQSIKSPILEAGAEALRESQRVIRNGLAKGGSARNAALAEARQMLAIESSNRLVGQQLWQANLNFEAWIRDYQTSTVNAAQAFSKGLGVREYTSAMNSASQFIVSTAIPTTANLAMQSFKLAQATKKKGVGELILGGITAAVGLFAVASGGLGGGGALEVANKQLFLDRTLVTNIEGVGGINTGPGQDLSFGAFGSALSSAAKAGKGLLNRLFGKEDVADTDSIVHPPDGGAIVQSPINPSPFGKPSLLSKLNPFD